MPSAAEEPSDLDAIAKDVAALKRDLAALRAHIRSGATDGLAGAARQTTTQLAEEAKELYAKLAAEGERTAEMLGRHVEEQPLTSLLLAFAAGLVAGRLMR